MQKCDVWELPMRFEYWLSVVFTKGEINYVYEHND